MSKSSRKVIFTANQVAIVINGATKVINSKNPIFKKVCQSIVDGISDTDLLNLLVPANRINSSKRAKNWGINIQNGQVYHNEELLPPDLAATIMEFQNADAPYEPLLKFYENCKLNPNEHARNGLFKFLQVHRFPLTEDGCFIGYRRVNSDFMDFHTGTINYNVGNTVKLDRAQCDSDHTVSCSRGLHVANFNYAKTQFYSGSGILIDVKVHPKDVVAFPNDYHFEKLRVCEMYVIGVNATVESEMHEHTELVRLQNSNWTPDERDDDEDDEDGAVVSVGEKQDAIEVPAWMNQERKSNGRFGSKVK